MNKIIRDGDWREVDMLDGTPLEDGEFLILQWPDGTMTAEPIIVHKGSYNVLDQGGPSSGTPIPTSIAYVARTFSGIRTEVPIVNLEAARNGAPK